MSSAAVVIGAIRIKKGGKNQNSAESGVAPAPGWVGGGGARHRCNINFSNGQSIGIVLLYGMCSHSLYIKGEN